MKISISLLIGLFCAGVASALSPPTCQQQWKCSPVFRAGLRPGEKITYKYEALHKIEVPGKTPQRLNIVTKAEIQAFKCRQTLKFTSTVVTSKEDAKKASIKQLQSIKQALEKNTVYFRSVDAHIDLLCSKDPAWVTNFKRGFLSFLQLPMRTASKKMGFDIEVIDIHGRCPVRIARGKRSWDANTIYAYRRLSACKNRYRSFGGLQSVPYSVQSPHQNPSLEAKQTCRYFFPSGNSPSRMPKEALCYEFIKTPPAIGSVFPLKEAKIVQKLKIVSRTRGHCRTPGCVNKDRLRSYRSSDLQMEFEPPTVAKISFAKIAPVICRLAGPVTPTTPVIFQQLVRFLKTAKMSDWRKVVHRKPKTLCPSQQPQLVKNVIVEALSMAADSRAVRYITSMKGKLAEKDSLLSNVAFVQRPTEQMINDVMPIFKKMNQLPRASLAAAALVHRFCSENGGAKCHSLGAVRAVMAPLESRLKSTRCRKMSVKTGTHLFRVLGNLPVPSRLHSYLFRCANDYKASGALRVAAIQALRRSPCPQAEKPLFRLFESAGSDVELRVAAYHALLRCPNIGLTQPMRVSLSRISNDHVLSYVITHMANVRSANDPDQRALRHFLHDLSWSPPKFTFRSKLSRHYQRSFYSGGSNLGVRAEGQLLWSDRSPGPRSASARLSANLLGRAVNFLELHGRMEGVQELIDRSNYPYYQQKFVPAKNGEAQLGVRLFGHDILAMHQVVTPAIARDMRYSRLKSLLTKNFKPVLRKNYIFADTSLVFPTFSGLPFRVDLWGGVSVDFEATSSVTDKKGYPKKVDLKFKPAATIAMEHTMAIDLESFKFGGKAESSGHTSTDLAVTAQLLAPRSFKIEMKAPERQQFLQLKWTYSTLRLKDVTPIVIPSAFPALSWSSKEYSGYRFKMYMLNNAFSYKKRFHNVISISAERTDTHKKYTLSGSFGKRRINVEMDTPGSKVNRRVYGNFLFLRKSVELSLTTPKGSFVAAIGENKKNSEYFCFARTGTINYFDLRWRATRQSPTTTHKITLKVKKLSVLTLTASRTRQREGSSFDVKIEDLVRKPIEVKGSVLKSRPNKWSIGAMNIVSLNMTSSFLMFDFNRKIEKSPNRVNGLLQLNYQLPTVAQSQGSATIKFGWMRMKDKSFRDRFTLKSSFSHLPQIDTDIVLKSNIISASNFRHQLTFKFGPKKIPLTASLTYLLDLRNPKEQKIVVELLYQLAKLSKGEASFRFKKNKKLLTFVTKLRQVLKGVIVVNHGMFIKRKPDNSFDASLSLSSGAAPISLQTRLKRPKAGGLSFIFDLSNLFKMTLAAKPFYQTVLLNLEQGQWQANAMLKPKSLRAMSYSFNENSQKYGLNFVGSHLFRRDNLRIAQTLKHRSGRIYDTSLEIRQKPAKVEGSFDFALGLKADRQKFSFSFDHDQQKNVMTSDMELLIGSQGASLRNDYSFEISSVQQKINGRSHLVSTFGRKRKIMLQTNINNLEDQLNLDGQFSATTDNVPGFVNFKFNIKDKNPSSFAMSALMDTSVDVIRNVDFDYRHQFTPVSFLLEGNANYLKESYKVSASGKKDTSDLSGKVSVGINNVQRSFSFSSAFSQPTYRVKASMELPDNIYEAAVTTGLDGQSSGELTSNPKTGNPLQLVKWAIQRSTGEVSLRLNLMKKSTELDINFAPSTFTFRFLQSEEARKLWKISSRLTIIEPFFEFLVRKESENLVKLRFTSSDERWNALAFANFRTTPFDFKTKITLDFEDLGFQKNERGFRFTGKALYFDVPVMSLKIGNNEDGLTIDGNCDGVVSPCIVKLQVPSTTQLTAYVTRRIPGSIVQYEEFPVIIMPKLVKTYIELGGSLLDFTFSAPEVDQSSAKFRAAVPAGEISVDLNASLKEKKKWTQKLKIFCSGADKPLTARLDWLTNAVSGTEDEVFGAIPKRYLDIKEISMETEMPALGVLEGRWNPEFQNSFLEAIYFGDVEHKLKLKISDTFSKVALTGRIQETNFGVNSNYQLGQPGTHELRLTIESDLPTPSGSQFVKLADLELNAALEDKVKIDASLSGPFISAVVKLTKDEHTFVLGRGDGVSKLGLEHMSYFRNPLTIELKNNLKAPKERMTFDYSIKYLSFVTSSMKCWVSRKKEVKYDCSADLYIKPGNRKLELRTWMINRREGGMTFNRSLSPTPGISVVQKDVYTFSPVESTYRRTIVGNFGRNSVRTNFFTQMKRTTTGQFQSFDYNTKVISQFYGKRALRKKIDFSLKRSAVSFILSGNDFQRVFVKNRGKDHLIFLQATTRPTRSQFQLLTGFSQKFLKWKSGAVRLDLSGKLVRSKSGRTGGLFFKMRRDTSMWVNSQLVFEKSPNRFAFDIAHKRFPRKGPKVSLDVSYKYPKTTPRTREFVAIYSKADKKIAVVSYTSKRKETALDVSLNGMRHLEVRSKAVSPQVSELTLRTLTMQKPAKLATMLTPDGLRWVIQAGGNRPESLFIDLFARNRRGFRIMLTRQGSARPLFNANYRPSTYGFATSLRIGSALQFNANKTGNRRGDRQYRFSFVNNRNSLTGRLANRRQEMVAVLEASGQRLMEMTRTRAKYYLTLPPVGVTINAKKNEFSLSDSSSPLAKFSVDRPTHNTIGTNLVWRSQRLRALTNSIVAKLRTSIRRFCSTALYLSIERLSGFQREASLVIAQPVSDLRTTVMETARAFDSVTAVLALEQRSRMIATSALTFAAGSARTLFVVGANLDREVDNSLQRFRLFFARVADRLTTIQALPDRYARRFGLLIKAATRTVLLKVINNLEKMETSSWVQASPKLRDVIPFEINDAKLTLQRMNEGLSKLNAMSMLYAAQHLDSKIHTSLKSLVKKTMVLIEAASPQLELDMERNVLKPWQPNFVKRKIIGLFSAMLPVIKESAFVTNYLLAVEHDMNEYMRGLLGASVPRIDQMNWRRGRVHIVWFLPLQPILPKMPRLNIPAADFSPFSPSSSKTGEIKGVSGSKFSYNVKTFDDLRRSWSRQCPSIILADFRRAIRREFRWTVRYFTRSNSVKITLGNRRLTVNVNGDLLVDGRRWSKKTIKVFQRNSVYTYRRGTMRVIDAVSTFGIRIEADPVIDRVKIKLVSPHYFGKLVGLFGNADNKPGNDFFIC